MNRSTWFVSCFFLCLMIIWLPGCDKYSKQRMLTFFFTGVPPLESEKAVAPLVMPDKIEPPTSQLVKKWGSIHGPYDAGECYHCHKVNNQSVAKKSGNSRSSSIPSLQDLPRELLLPKNAICVECHTTKSLQSAYTRDLWMHGPVSNGACTACHHHHKSANPYLLLKTKSTDLCQQCHIKNLISEIEEHMHDKECSTCHNAHVGKDRFLLKKDMLEIF